MPFPVLPLPTHTHTHTTMWFPCQPFQRDNSGVLVWKLRKCVIAESVGGKRSSVSGGMPKGRNEWVAEPYIKRSSPVLGVQAHSDSLVFASISKAEIPRKNKAGTKHSRTRYLDQLSRNLGDRRPDFQFERNLHPPCSSLCPSSSSHLCHVSPWRPAWTRCLPICCLW